MTRIPEPRLGDDERAARFEAMFKQHAPRVYAYAARRSTPDLANEVVAETFLIAWRKPDAVPDEPLPWLLNVASKVLANRRRSDERRGEFVRGLARAAQSTPAFDPADEVATRMSVQAALQRLPPAEREALRLVAWDGLDIAAGAVAAGCSRATFSVRLHRARRRLLKELGLSRHQRVTTPTQSATPPKEAKST